MAGRGEIQIVYEDDCLIVIDKPSGLLTMSTGKEGEVTAYSILTDYVRHKGNRRRQADRIYIVHRLDRYTSGLLVFAKDPETKYALQDNWNDVVLERNYVAVLEGTPSHPEGTIESWLREDNATHTVHSVRGKTEGAKYAVTHYNVLDSCPGGWSLVEFELETGRKNQIRVHASDMGHPVAGDKKYGARTNPLGRVALHARTLCFIHPYTGETLRFDTGIPRRFTSLFKGK